MAEETNQLRVRLVTPERVFFDHAASAVELPSKSGYFEVLYGHAPLMDELGAGDVIIHGGDGAPESVLRYNVSWGFAEVLGDRVTVLASDALKPEEIDVPRAQDQLERGNKLWNEAGESVAAYDNALRVIHEAEAKIASAAEKN
jgi:F-type H+-transporting ATPase subunit epsilon